MKHFSPLMLLAPLLLSASVVSSDSVASASEIVAHRGASFDAPENTLASLRLGFEQGADAGELDIHLSKDGQAVLMHDASTRRTGGVDKPVAEQTLAELRALDVGVWKELRWANERVPTLAEALATTPQGKRMFVEIKCGVEVLPELERVIRASGKKPEQIVLIGFGLETMRAAKALLPDLEACWLASYKAGADGRIPGAEELIEKAKQAGMDGLDLNARFLLGQAGPGFAAKVREAGLKLYAWTVDDPAQARALAALGVDGITTNRPAWLREQIKAPASQPVK